MKPITLKAKKFEGLKKVNITFDQPLSMVFGINGAGKTSLADALRYASGAPVRSLPFKESGDLGLDGDNYTVELGVGKKSLKATKTGRPKESEITEVLGVSKKAVEFCLDSDRMLAADPKKLKGLLEEVLQLEYDWKAACAEEGCDKKKLAVLPKEAKKAAKEAEARRAACKADQVEEPEDEDVEVRGGTAKLSEIPLDAIEQSIREKEAEYEQAVGKHACIFDRRLDDAGRTQAEDELQELRAKIEAAPDVDAEKAKLRELEQEKAKLMAEHNQLQLRQKEIQAMCGKAEEILDIKFCPKCKKLVESRLLKGQGQDQAIEGSLAKLVERIRDLTTEVGRLTAKLDAVEDLGEARARLRELERLLESDMSDEDLAAIKATIDELQERLRFGRGLRDKLRDYHNALEAYNQAQDNSEVAQVEWNAWDKIAKTIPEVEKAGVASGLDPYREALAKYDVLDGAIEISDDLGITYAGRRIELLSDSERYRVNLVLYFGVVELFGFPFALVDRGDIVVTDVYKDKLLKALVTVASQRPVLFLQARLNDKEIEETAKKEVKGIGFYHVVKQTVKRLSA
jgi:hypothetical protein